MSANPPSAENAAKAPAPAAKAIENPALRMLGLPRLRAKLPGRNWLIFWGVLATWSGTVYYDRRQKKIIQQKWCNAVSHLSAEPLPVNALPRKITVFLSAPPGDSLRPVREQFQEYVKPILVAAGVDWEAIEGRKEGDVRAAFAEKIRKRRRRQTNQFTEDDEDVVEDLRLGLGVHTLDDRGGDLIVGRHTWKEYLRGLHEGWLGPLQAAPVVEKVVATEPSPDTPSDETKPEEKTPPKPSPTPPYITPKDYPHSTPDLPQEFPITSILENPHLLGFLKTPTRIYRYLNRRKLAEEQGREVVNLLLTMTPQMYQRSEDWEQKDIREIEEKDWHKSARSPNPEGEEDKERPWIEQVTIDDRIGSRMRKAELVPVGTESQGHLLAWRGAADPVERISWLKWLKWAFDVDYPEPKCKGWEDGLKGEDGN